MKKHKEHGIIFKAEMVRAILSGSKTQTRRLSKRWLKVKKGDLFWVKETWARAYPNEPIHLFYRAGNYGTKWGGKWRSSMFMPRWASRITLRATQDAYEEPLQDITEEDAVREGLYDDGGWSPDNNDYVGLSAGHRFIDLWNSINTKPGSRWEDNPGVVVLNFKKIEGSRP
jgi:hypothetical protein